MSKINLEVFKVKWLNHGNGEFEYFPLEANAIWFLDKEDIKKHWKGYGIAEYWQKKIEIDFQEEEEAKQ